jgi:hypothetical protein
VDIRLATRRRNGDLLRLRDHDRDLAPDTRGSAGEPALARRADGPAAGTLVPGKLTDGRQEAPRREAQIGSH